MEFVRVLLSEDGNLAALEDDVVVIGADFIGVPGAVGRVVFEKIGKGLRVNEVVDGDNFHSFFVGATERKTSDAAEAIDC